jgi:hypothetical protein
VQNSINQLQRGRNSALAGQQALMANLLFRNDPICAPISDRPGAPKHATDCQESEAGVFVSGGSAEGGVRGRIAFGNGFSLLGGLAESQESYDHAKVGASPFGALALRYVWTGTPTIQPFAEVGGWFSPSVDLKFTRSYMNGAGTAVGQADTSGSMSYLFGRLGIAVPMSPADEAAISAEFGYTELSVDGYQEGLSKTNPFPATVASSTSSMNLGKIEGQWTHTFSDVVDTTLMAGFAHGFGGRNGFVAGVEGVGVFMPISNDPVNWFEYGARVGFRFSPTIRVDLFADGETGGNGIGSKVHAGAGLNVKF